MIGQLENNGPRGSGRAFETGVSLIELMIALALSLVLIGGLIQVFLGNRVTYALNEGLSRIQEHGRFVLDHVAYTTRMAGHTGCIAGVPIFNNLADIDGLRDPLRNGLQGYEFIGTGPNETYRAPAGTPAPATNPNDWDPPLPAALVGRVIPGSDVLVVRGVSGVASPLVAPFSNSAQLFIAEPHGFVQGQILVVTDCQKASIFQVTRVTDSPGNTVVNLVHSAQATFQPGNAAPLLGQSYGLGSEVAALEVAAFYVGVGRDGGPSLYQLRLQRIDDSESRFQPEELVEGVDTIQIRYGIDTDNDGQSDAWSPATAGMDWQSVLAVEIGVLTRSPDEYGRDVNTAVYSVAGTRFDPADDRRMRQVFSTTIGVRNRLP
jgi:type IV pilus assembly protein PilW